ncbi:MAG: M20/M25/M40 family metallo-hydrolase, partial [Candidatus Competibacterales bacterium]
GPPGIRGLAFTLAGQATHAGTTPMDTRRDPGYLAGCIIQYLRMLSQKIEGLRATAGRVIFEPNLINVIPQRVQFTADLRHRDGEILERAAQQVVQFVHTMAAPERVEVQLRTLADFAPVAFDPQLVQAIADAAQSLGYSDQRLYSGAGHDAQLMARSCPAAMIFVPSRGGISHNIAEDTAPEALVAGGRVLLRLMAQLAEVRG